MLGLKLKRGLKIILYVFSAIALILIGYYYFAIISNISSLKKIASTLQSGANAILASLTKISSFISIETILMLVTFLVFIITINYLLNWYFLEKKNALVDELTGVYNRKAMKIWLAKEIERAQRFDHPLSIAMVDVDSFKNYNDKQGHLRGDWLLKSLGRILKEGAREMDFVGRYGGEEFIIIFPETEHSDAVKAADRIRALVESTKFPGGDMQPKGKVTISIGLVTFHKLLEEENMIKKADELLYQAKAGGRNLVVHQKYN
jgi:diguanylate cyclase (GGDEF)-like protein